MDLWVNDGIGLALLHTAIIALCPLMFRVCDLAVGEYQDTLDTFCTDAGCGSGRAVGFMWCW